MYGDSEVIRRRVAALRDQEADVRALADELLARLDALGWTGRAADAMRARVTDRITHLRRAADRHLGAADALAAHAEALDRTKDDITVVEDRVAALVADARGRVAAIDARNEASGGPAVLPDPLDEQLVAFVPPPPGHRDWLAVDVPGQER